jgi:hypothetical protein
MFAFLCISVQKIRKDDTETAGSLWIRNQRTGAGVAHRANRTRGTLVQRVVWERSRTTYSAHAFAQEG